MLNNFLSISPSFISLSKLIHWNVSVSISLASVYDFIASEINESSAILIRLSLFFNKWVTDVDDIRNNIDKITNTAIISTNVNPFLFIIIPSSIKIITQIYTY